MKYSVYCYYGKDSEVRADDFDHSKFALIVKLVDLEFVSRMLSQALCGFPTKLDEIVAGPINSAGCRFYYKIVEERLSATDIFLSLGDKERHELIEYANAWMSNEMAEIPELYKKTKDLEEG